MTKRCVRCDGVKPVGLFGENQKYADGLTKTCSACIAKVSAWVASNRDRHAANRAAWFAANPEKARTYKREWYEKNSEQQKSRMKANYRKNRKARLEAMKVWAQQNPAAIKAHKAANAAKRRAAGGACSSKQWRQILMFYGNRCAHCHVQAAKRPLTVDHYLPIAKGGTHDWTNLWPLCLPCNLKKGTSVAKGLPPHAVKLQAVI